MKRFPIPSRTVALVAVIAPLLALFIYVALRSGPLASIAVTVARAEAQSITPALFGIGTVEARYTYRIGPTFAGRVQALAVHVGDPVKAGQLLGEMDPVDLGDRMRSQQAASRRVAANLREAQTRYQYAQTEYHRNEQLLASHLISVQAVDSRRQELQIAESALLASREDLARARADERVIASQSRSLHLVAPVDGIVVARDADPGTTVVAGQPVVEIIDPRTIWINVRFDQLGAAGLAATQRAHIVLRSRPGASLAGRVVRVEPRADAVTEESLAKVILDVPLEPMPSLGELAEATVELPQLPATPVIPNAAVRRDGSRVGVWRIVNGDLQFSVITLGASDLDGRVQVLGGLHHGDQVVTYSEKALSARSRVHVVERIPGVMP